MRFRINQIELNCALQHLIRNTDNKFFADFKLITADGLLLIQATNGEVSMEYKLKADTLDNDIMLVNARKFTDIINKLDGVVEFNNGLIKAGKNKLKIETKKADDFVFCQEIDGNYFEIETKELQQGIKNRLFACSSVSTQVLSGICLNQDEIAGCDGNVLAIYKLNKKMPFEPIVISNKTAQEILKIFTSDKIKVLIIKNKIAIKNDNINFVGAILNADYPKYKQLVPKPVNNVKLNKIEVIKALELLKLIDEKHCQFAFDKNCLTLKNNNSEITIDIDYSNEEMAIWFNINYMIDCLKNINKDIVDFGFTNRLSACVLKSDNEVTLIMPVNKSS